MFPEDQGPAETAIACADQFLEAGAARLDGLFGAGYAKANPPALAAYVAACASNINAFMTAAVAAATLDEGEDDLDIALDDVLAAFQQAATVPAPKPKGRRR